MEKWHRQRVWGISNLWLSFPPDHRQNDRGQRTVSKRENANRDKLVHRFDLSIMPAAVHYGKSTSPINGWRNQVYCFYSPHLYRLSILRPSSLRMPIRGRGVRLCLLEASCCNAYYLFELHPWWIAIGFWEFLDVIENSSQRYKY